MCHYIEVAIENIEVLSPFKPFFKVGRVIAITHKTMTILFGGGIILVS